MARPFTLGGGLDPRLSQLERMLEAGFILRTEDGDITVSGGTSKVGPLLTIAFPGGIVTIESGGLALNGMVSAALLSGNQVTTPILSAAGTAFETAALSPANITASQNNYAPSGVNNTRTLRLTANSGLSITGISAGQTSGRRLRICNVGTNAITLTHESGSSSAANRFRCPGAANFSLAADGAVDLWYDGTSSRWRLMR